MDSFGADHLIPTGVRPDGAVLAMDGKQLSR
jgi:hypothetical protein